MKFTWKLRGWSFFLKMNAEEALDFFFGLNKVGDSSVEPSEVSSASEFQDEGGNDESVAVGNSADEGGDNNDDNDRIPAPQGCEHGHR